MRNFRKAGAALALAVVLATGMASVTLSANDGNFQRPSNEQICAALARAEASLGYVPAAFRAILQQYIDAAQKYFGC